MADKIKDNWQHLKRNEKTGDMEEVEKDTRNYPAKPNPPKSWGERHPRLSKAVRAYESIPNALGFKGDYRTTYDYKKGGK